jgi:hypothetical protein
MDEKRHREWLEFAVACKSFWTECDFQEKLVTACGGAEDIAWAIYFHHGASSLEWLEAEVAFLGQTRPCDLIEHGKGDRVRECLWRTP